MQTIRNRQSKMSNYEINKCSIVSTYNNRPPISFCEYGRLKADIVILVQIVPLKTYELFNRSP